MSTVSNFDSKKIKFLDKVEYIDFSEAKTTHDRVLVVEDKRFYIQSEVLSLSSDYFGALLNSGFDESTQKEIVLNDVSAPCFEYFLKTVHPANLIQPIDWFKMTDASFLIDAFNFSLRIESPEFLQEVKRAIREEFMFYKLARFDLVKFIEMVLSNEDDEFKDYVFEFLGDQAYATDRKEEIMKAPEHIKHFVLNAYMEGNIQTIKNGGFGFESNESVGDVWETTDEDW